ENARLRIDELQRQNAELGKQIDELEKRLESFGTIIDRPQIDGHVLEVKTDLGLVVLDKGSRNGVKVGFVFDIYLGAKYKGQVRISDVQEGMSSGTILHETNPIARGDDATTSLGG